MSNNDPLESLKHRGYFYSQGVPNSDTLTIPQLTAVAKFYLCRIYKLPLRNPIWDTYTTEELLIEYYAHLFHNNKEFREEFEANSGLSKDYYEDFADFAEKEIEKSQKEREEKATELEEKISFNPNDL